MAMRAMSHIAENFTRDKMTGETLDVYAELLQEKYNLQRIATPEEPPLLKAAE